MKSIIRETNPEILDVLKPYFVADGYYTKDVAADEIVLQMKYNPDEICVLVGYENDNIAGFIIGWKVPNRVYAYIGELYSKMDSDFAKQGLDMFVDWCKSLGLKEIRGETERDSVQMRGIKQYGFIEHGVVMTRII